MKKIVRWRTVFLSFLEVPNTWHLLNRDYQIEGIKFKTIPAYNTTKQFHPKSNNWVGYIITVNDKSITGVILKKN
jgi:hypothetical protein